MKKILMLLGLLGLNSVARAAMETYDAPLSSMTINVVTISSFSWTKIDGSTFAPNVAMMDRSMVMFQHDSSTSAYCAPGEATTVAAGLAPNGVQGIYLASRAAPVWIPWPAWDSAGRRLYVWCRNQGTADSNLIFGQLNRR